MPSPYYVYWGAIHQPGQEWEGPFYDIEKARDFIFRKADELDEATNPEETLSEDGSSDISESDNSSLSEISENFSTGVYYDPTGGKDDGNIYVISSIPPQKEDSDLIEDDEDEIKDDLIIRKILAWEFNGPDLANYWFPHIDLFPAKYDEIYISDDDNDDQILDTSDEDSDEEPEQESSEQDQELLDIVEDDSDDEKSEKSEEDIWPKIMMATNENETLEALAENEANYQSELGWTPLMEARSLSQVKILKNNGADEKLFSKENWNALLLARTTGITKYLLKLGMDPNHEVNGNTPLTMAKFPGQTLALLKAGAKIDREDSLSPLFYNKNPKQIYHLLDNGADPEAVDENGKTVPEVEELDPVVKEIVKMAIEKKTMKEIKIKFKKHLQGV